MDPESLAWLVSLGVAVAATVWFAVRCLRTSERGLAVRFAVLGATICVFGICLVLAEIGTGPWWMIGAYGAQLAWMPVLAALQYAALHVHDEIAARLSRALQMVLALGIVVALAGGILLPPAQLVDAAGAPTILPTRLVLGEPAQLLSAGIAVGWMLSLLVVPLTLWIRVRGARGDVRAGLARAALGAVAPAIVVALCGVLALSIGSTGARGFESTMLAAGFGLAIVTTCWWLTATLDDARARGSRVRTSAAALTRVALWVAFAALLAQVSVIVVMATETVAPLVVVLCCGIAAGGALAWHRFVEQCVRRVDPSLAVVDAVVRAQSAAVDDEPGVVAERALVEATGDDTLRLFVRLPAGTWIDAVGTAVDEPSARDGTSLAVVDGPSGRSRAAAVHRARFRDVAALVREMLPLLDRAALQAEVRAHAARASAQAARAESATVEARRRIERDLHDGVQGRLLALGLHLQLQRDATPDAVSRLAFDEAVASLAAAVTELRALSTGRTATRLARDGLRAALHELVALAPIPVDVEIAELDVSQETAATAYFVVAEAMSNALKHAGAGRLRVIVTEGRECLRVEVVDDGRGGADPREGSGLRGLSERVERNGGTLLVSDAEPHGTRVEAEVR